MAPRLLLALALASLVLVAGCAEPAAKDAKATTSAPPPSPPTDETGNLEVVSVGDDELPVPDVNVGLRETGDLGITGDDGSFTFDKLVPGPYTVDVQKLGYDSAAKSIDVIAGETVTLQFVLPALKSKVPSMNMTTINGLMGCSGPQYTYPCIIQEEGVDQSLHCELTVEDGVGDVIADVYWTPNAPGFPANLQIRAHDAGYSEDIATAEGPSPLRLILPLEKYSDESGDGFTFCLSMYTGEMDAAAHQEYEIDLSVFYHQKMPADYKSRPE